jgi:hypothetical protein
MYWAARVYANAKLGTIEHRLGSLAFTIIIFILGGMKRTLLLLAAVGFIITARADVLIERASQTSRYTGQGRERTLRLNNILVRDLDGTNGASIETTVINGHKLYHVSRDGTPVFRTTVRGARDREYTVITLGATETNDTQVVQVSGLLARGLNTTLQVTDSRQLTYARVLRGSAHRVELNEGEYVVTETTYTRLYSQTETRDANTRGDNVEAVIARVVQRLEATGYVNAP